MLRLLFSLDLLCFLLNPLVSRLVGFSTSRSIYSLCFYATQYNFFLSLVAKGFRGFWGFWGY